jgi:hypothetical protein
MKQYIMYDNRPIALIYRREGEDETLTCPFCKSTHIHGKSEGHRIAHCAWAFTRAGNVKYEPKDEIIADDGTKLYRAHGYVIVNIGAASKDVKK